MNHLRVGGGSEFVLFELPAAEVCDGWYYMQVSVAVPGFNGSVQAYLEPADFRHFEQQLKVLHETLRGTAELRPIEKQVVVVLAGNGRGGVEVSGELASTTSQNKLEYSFEIDQTYLATTLAQLSEFTSGSSRADA